MKAGQAHIWLVPLDEVAEEPALLDDRELARAARFLRQADRQRYVRSHTALRRILAQCLDRAPEELVFREGENGKPVLADGNVDFSLSHSGGMALIGVARETIGVDIEAVRQGVDYREIAARFGMADGPGGSARELTPLGFFQAWTRQEASGKAAGRGLSASVAQLAAFPAVNVDAPEGYAAAVALGASSVSEIDLRPCPHPAYLPPA